MNKAILFVALFSLIAVIIASPLPKDVVTADDVHLNAVLPEDIDASSIRSKQSSSPTTTSKTEEQTTDSDQGPELTSLTPSDSSYFSRVITSIFEIPIQVLTAVRNLLNTATTRTKISA